MILPPGPNARQRPLLVLMVVALFLLGVGAGMALSW